jgi:hypothetical protein
MRARRVVGTMSTMRLQRRLSNEGPNSKRRRLDIDRDERAPSEPDEHRSLIAAVDSAIAAVAGSAALPAAEVIDLLLDLRSRIAAAPV